MIRKTIFIFTITLCLLGLVIYASQTTTKIEAGVPVVLNHIGPNKNVVGPTNLSLEKEFVIATGNEEMLMVGLTDIHNFDIDSAGNIFIIQWMTSEHYIYKFGSTGKFIKSFLRKGQGPGELEWGGTVLVDRQNKILAKDPSKEMPLFYDCDGNYIREQFLGSHMEIEAVLDNGNYLTTLPEIGPELEKNELWLCSPKYEKIKLLATQSFPNRTFASKIKVGEDRIIQAASKDRIYAGYSADGYSISMYDLDGKLCRIIKKEYGAVKIQDEEKKAFQKLVRSSPDRGKYYFADHWPPFRYCFADEEGRLFVMTFERRPNSREATYDVFNPDGAFITRIQLDNLDENIRVLRVKAKNNRIYCLRANDDGYKELVVYKTHWK